MVGRWPSGAPLVNAPDQDVPRSATTTTSAIRLTCSGWPAPSARTSVAPTRAIRWPPSPLPRLTPASCTACCAGRAATSRPGTAVPKPGCYFLCLAANLSRQFEFVQRTWLNNATFGGLYDDTDPLTGTRQPAGATFTVPQRPVRHRYRGLPQFVRTRGGAYFFLPGISALRYLAQLRQSDSTHPGERDLADLGETCTR